MEPKISIEVISNNTMFNIGAIIIRTGFGEYIILYIYNKEPQIVCSSFFWAPIIILA